MKLGLYLSLLASVVLNGRIFANAGTQSLRSRQTRSCNLHPELCDRSVGNVTFAGAHDSFTNSSDPEIILSSDQEIGVTAQLNLGVRFVENQAHLNPITGELHLCHTSCFLFDGGTVEAYTAEVNAWLDENPNDFVIMLFTNGDELSLTEYWDPALQSSGIVPKVFIPTGMPIARLEWPTIGELLDSGKQALILMDECPDGSTGDAGDLCDPSVPYIFGEFPVMVEDAFGDTDEVFDCAPNRFAGPLAVPDHLSLANHVNNLDILGIMTADFEDASETNSISSILAHANNCTGYFNGLYPNVILADFVDIGQVIAAVDMLNGF